MTPTEIRTAVRSLQAQGRSLRDQPPAGAVAQYRARILREPVGKACRGATMRWRDAEQAEGRLHTSPRQRRPGVRELLADDGLDVPYSSLTRWVREAELRGNVLPI
jgi:hypothetical protein